jgi:hypothetical protein
MERIGKLFLVLVAIVAITLVSGCDWYNPVSWFGDEEPTQESKELDEAEKAIEAAEESAGRATSDKDMAKKELDDAEAAAKTESERAAELRKRYDAVGTKDE